MRPQPGLDDLAGLLERAVEGVDDDDAPLRRVLVVEVPPGAGADGLQQQLAGHLAHVRLVAPDSDDEPALPAAFVVRQDLGAEQVLRAGRAAEDDVRVRQVLGLFGPPPRTLAGVHLGTSGSSGQPAKGGEGGGANLQTRVIAVPRGEDAELGGFPALTLLDGLGHDVELLEDVLSILAKAAVYNVDVTDGAPPEQQGEAYMPVCLQATSEYDLSIFAGFS